jgi:hypothetical protein
MVAGGEAITCRYLVKSLLLYTSGSPKTFEAFDDRSKDT